MNNINVAFLLFLLAPSICFSNVQVSISDGRALVTIDSELQEQGTRVSYSKVQSFTDISDVELIGTPVDITFPIESAININSPGKYILDVFLDNSGFFSNSSHSVWTQYIYIPEKIDTKVETLAMKYRPITIYHADEEYFPHSIEDIFSYSPDREWPVTISKNRLKKNNVFINSSRLGDYMSLYGASNHFINISEISQTCNDGIGNPICIPHYTRYGVKDSSTLKDNYKIYWSASSEGEDIYLNYHYFYLFDPKTGSNTNPAIASHSYDRESFTVKLSKAGNEYKPVNVTYAGHLDFQLINFLGDSKQHSTENSLASWDKGNVTVSWENAIKAGSHPVVYKAKGAHAIYPAQGNYSVITAGKYTGTEYAELIEEAGSEYSPNILFHTDNSVSLEKLDLSEINPLSFSGTIVDGYFGRFRFTPFINRLPADQWLLDINAPFDICLNSRLCAPNDLSILQDKFNYIHGLENHGVMTVKLIDINSGLPVIDSSVRLSPEFNDFRPVHVGGEYTFIYDNSSVKEFELFYKLDGQEEKRCYTFTSTGGGFIENKSGDEDAVNNKTITCRVGNRTPLDTDKDGLTDEWEEANGLNPNKKDTDGDGVEDAEEVGDLENPKDTDSDGVIDALDETNQNPCLPEGINNACYSLAEVFSVSTNPLAPVAGTEVLFTIGGKELPSDMVIRLEGAECSLEGLAGRNEQQFRCQLASDKTGMLQLYAGRFGGETIEGTPVDITVTATATKPDAPTNLQTTSTVDHIAISWDSVEGVDSYYVYVSESPNIVVGATGVTRYGSGNNSTIIGGEEGIRYYIAVSSLLDEIESDLSEEVSASILEPEIEGIIVSYDFNGDLDDTSPNNFDGVSENPLNFGFFGERQALVMNGINDYFIIPDNGAIDFSERKPFTISTWIRIDGEIQIPRPKIVSNYNSGVSGEFYLDISDNATVGLVREISPFITETAATIPTNEFVLVTATYNGDVTSVYINDQLEASRAMGSSRSDTSNVLVGAVKVNNEIVEHFKGHIDNLLILDNALTPSEVSQLYEQGKTTGESLELEGIDLGSEVTYLDNGLPQVRVWGNVANNDTNRTDFFAVYSSSRDSDARYSCDMQTASTTYFEAVCTLNTGRKHDFLEIDVIAGNSSTDTFASFNLENICSIECDAPGLVDHQLL